MYKTIKMNLFLKKYYKFKIESEKKYKKIIKKNMQYFIAPIIALIVFLLIMWLT